MQNHTCWGLELGLTFIYVRVLVSKYKLPIPIGEHLFELLLPVVFIFVDSNLALTFTVNLSLPPCRMGRPGSPKTCCGTCSRD